MSKRRKLTDEEKKEKQRLYNKAYHEANKERLNRESREYYQANKEVLKKKSKEYVLINKEKTDKYQREYRGANKEKTKEYNKAYMSDNRERLLVQRKEARDSKIMPYNIIYCIPNYDGKGGNYCGVTKRPDTRMSEHRSCGKQNVNDWFILDIIIDRAEALTRESEFHKLGYHGGVGDTRQRKAA